MQNSGRHGKYLFGFRDLVDKVQGEGSRVKVIITHLPTILTPAPNTLHPSSPLLQADGYTRGEACVTLAVDSIIASSVNSGRGVLIVVGCMIML
jgi:hypothetical protein